MQLGRLGVWYPTDRLDGPGLRDLLRTVEGCGYAALWYHEARGYESLSLAAFLLANSGRLLIGSSIANIYARDAFTARRGLISLNALFGGRFILGLGVSHAPTVEGLRGHRYEKPVPAMRAYLDGLCEDQDGSLLPGAEDWPVVIAALGPRMLALTAERARGAVPYNVTPAHTAQAAAILGPSKWLAVEQKVCLETDPVRARALGRKELARYMGLPNYRNNWLRLGFDESDFVRGGSDRLKDAMVGWGDEERALRPVREHLEAGASHVCIQVLGPEVGAPPREDWRRLAPAALAL